MTDKDLFKTATYNILNKQVGGHHYQNMKLQPAYFICENNLPWAEGNAIGYICRHKQKGKRLDIEKAIQFLEMIIERDYS